MRIACAVAIAVLVSACSGGSGIDHDALKSINDIPEGPGLLTGESGTFERQL